MDGKDIIKMSMRELKRLKVGGGNRQAHHAEGGGLDDRAKREAGAEACQGGKG